MRNKTILRVAEGTELNSAMKTSLKNILGQDFDIEYYGYKPSLQRSYERRVNILDEAFQFITQAIPLGKNIEDIKAYQSWCRKNCVLRPNKPIDTYQTILSQYTVFLVDGLLDCCEWPAEMALEEKKHLAIELLNKAEQYVLMQKGRSNIATLSTESIYSEHDFILQWEKQLPPCSTETLEELKQIKKNKLNVTPAWFRELPIFQQIFFHSSEAHLKTKELLKSNLSQLEDIWKNIKKALPTSSLTADLAAIAADKKPFPSWFLDLSSSHQAVIKALSHKKYSEIDSNLIALDDFMSKLTQSSLENLLDLRKLPYWYLALSEHEQRLLKKSLMEVKVIEDSVSFLSSRHRTLPGVANFGEHHLLILSTEGKVEFDFDTRLRSSHVASRDVKDQAAVIGELHCRRNLNLISEAAGDKPIHYQTLISPVKAPLINSVVDKVIPDRILDEQLQKGIIELRERRKQPVYLTNHPFNMVKKIMPTFSHAKGCIELLRAGENKLLPSVVKKQALSLGISEEVFLNSGICEAIGFTCAYSNNKAFAQIKQLVRSISSAASGVEKFDRCNIEKILNLACTEVSLLKQNLPNLAPSELNPDEEKLKQILVKFFANSATPLPDWKGWQTVFANLWLLTNDAHSDAKLLNFINRACDLAQIVGDYRDLLNSGYGTGWWFDYNGRELWLSSLESLLIIHRDGLSYGSCVSGKDRKAIELIHTDAMVIFKEKYGSWPSINDVGLIRANFVEIVANLYISRHAHEHAGQNAPGADGIKTPANYWPGDIAKAICDKLGKDALNIDNILATNNEVKHIGNISSKLQVGYANYLIEITRLDNDTRTKLLDELNVSAITDVHDTYELTAAMRLSEENRIALLGQLKIIVGEKTHWNEQKLYKLKYWEEDLPVGIAQIKKILEAKQEVSTIKRLADVYCVINDRLTRSSFRGVNTTALYSCLHNLQESQKPELILNSELAKLAKIKKVAFESNGTGTAVPQI